MKVLLSAYACEPDKGSEPEVGLQALLAAAKEHDVWALTRENNLPPLRRYLSDHPVRERVHLEGLDVPGRALRAKRRGLPGLHWYYDTWQRAAAFRARELDARVRFDVVHHVTFAAYWTRVGVAAVDKPFVWGPVGGGVESPLRLLPELGPRGLAGDLARMGTHRLAEWAPHSRVTRRASVTLVQNEETGRRIRTGGEVLVLPNATAVSLPRLSVPGPRNHDVAFVGRLIPLKAPLLAVRALRYVEHPEAVLKIYGDGPERRRVERAIIKWGLSDRVELVDPIPRDVLLARVASAGVLLHTALHDESPLAVAEALSLGTPVVCLDHGGPAEVTARWPSSPSRRVSPQAPEATSRSLAEAIDKFLYEPAPVPPSPLRPETSFAEEILGAYGRAVAG